MKTTVGLWIDHKKAVIVYVTGRDEEMKMINSDGVGSSRQEGESVPSDPTTQGKQKECLNHYYDEVISSLWNSGAILIMGPGDAKTELKERMKLTRLNGSTIELETVDKLTNRQIAAKARAHSLKHSPVVGSR